MNPFEIELVCHILPIIIEDMPCCSIPIGSWNIPQELVPQLADPFFSAGISVDLLIVGGMFFDLLKSGSNRQESS